MAKRTRTASQNVIGRSTETGDSWLPRAGPRRGGGCGGDIKGLRPKELLFVVTGMF